MATILVDYENVSTTDGLKGVEYLNEKDTLIIQTRCSHNSGRWDIYITCCWAVD